MGLMINKTTNEVQHCPSENVMIGNGWSTNYWAYFDEEITADKVYNYIDGELVDISQTAEYLAEQRKIMIQEVKIVRDKAINEITNAKLLDDLQLDAGQITEAVHSARKATRLAQLAEMQTTFYTTTGLTPPTSITA